MNGIIDTRYRLRATSTADSVRGLRAQAAEIAAEAGADAATIESVRLAVNEALANVVTHAYAGREGRLEMDVGVAHGELTVVVRDHGVGVEHQAAAPGAGLGLLIIERLTDRLSIRSTLGRGTELTMVFRTTSAEPSCE